MHFPAFTLFLSHGSARALLELLDGEPGRERLLQLVRLLTVGHHQGVEEARTTHFELDIVRVALDLHRLGVLPPSLQQDFHDLARHPDYLFLIGSELNSACPPM